MGIVTRFVRLCKADIHGVMDQLEDKELLLKQYLRDMRGELDRKEAELNGLIGSRDQAGRELEALDRDKVRVEQDLALALEKDKDDIARMLIRKLRPLRMHCEELEAHRTGLDKDIAEAETLLAEQRQEYDEYKLKAREYVRSLGRDRLREADPLEPETSGAEITDMEVELELMQRKEALSKKGKGGSKS